MPIRPSERARYPREWKTISKRIRERAEQRCQCTGECGDHPHALCNAPNGKLIIRDVDDPARYTIHAVCGGCAGGDPECARAIRVVLTVAHLDHTPEHCDESNLLAMCQRCHLRYDNAHHVATARQTRHARKADRDLFAAEANK